MAIIYITIQSNSIEVGAGAFKGCPSTAKYHVVNDTVRQKLLSSQSDIQESQIELIHN